MSEQNEVPPEVAAELPSKQAKQSPKKYITEIINSENFLSSLEKVLPNHIKPNHLVRVALTAMNKMPSLFLCSPESLFSCLLDLANMGLEPDGRHAHLIPFQEKGGKLRCTLILDYKGIVELALRSPNIASVQAIVVKENDYFKWANGEIEHVISIKEDRGPLKAVYSKVILIKNGVNICQHGEPMSKQEIDAVRSRSKAKESGPWNSDYNEMAKKTVIRRDSKYWTLSPEVSQFISKYDEVEFQQVQPIRKTFAEAISQKETPKDDGE